VKHREAEALEGFGFNKGCQWSENGNSGKHFKKYLNPKS